LQRYHSECLSHNCIMINTMNTSWNMITLLLGDLSVKWFCCIWFVWNKRGFCVVAVQSECFSLECRPCFHKISLVPLQLNIHHTWYGCAIIVCDFVAQSISETFFHRNWVEWFSNLKVWIIDIYSTVSSFTTLSTWLHFLQEWTATKDISILLVDTNLKWPAWLLPQFKATQRTNYEKPFWAFLGSFYCIKTV